MQAGSPGTRQGTGTLGPGVRETARGPGHSETRGAQHGYVLPTGGGPRCPWSPGASPPLGRCPPPGCGGPCGAQSRCLRPQVPSPHIPLPEGCGWACRPRTREPVAVCLTGRGRWQLRSALAKGDRPAPGDTVTRLPRPLREKHLATVGDSGQPCTQWPSRNDDPRHHWGLRGDRQATRGLTGALGRTAHKHSRPRTPVTLCHHRRPQLTSPPRGQQLHRGSGQHGKTRQRHGPVSPEPLPKGTPGQKLAAKPEEPRGARPYDQPCPRGSRGPEGWGIQHGRGPGQGRCRAGFETRAVCSCCGPARWMPLPQQTLLGRHRDRWTFSTEAPWAGRSHAPASLLTYNLEEQNAGAHSSRASGVHTRPEGAAGFSLPPCPGGL